MPRRKANDGPAPPKQPRTRRKKVVQEEPKPEVYDPMNGYGMEGMDPNMYGHPHPEYGYGNYGPPPPFAGPEGSNSHYGMPPPQGNNAASNMMMRSQATAPVTLQQTVSPLEFRIHDINRRLYIFSTTGVAESDQQQWWNAFSHEFFDDECKLWFVIGPETVPFEQRERYVISRQFIPRFFRSIFESGMRELQYILRGPSRECTIHNGHPAYENDHVLQITKYDHPNLAEVNTEGKLFVEFTPYDEVLNYRIKAWTLELRQSNEFTYNPATKQFVPEAPSGNQENQPKMGFFQQTLKMMQMLKILEPMQNMMSSAKAAPNFPPRDLMRRTLFDHYHKIKIAKQHQEQQERYRQQQQMNQQMAMIPPAEPEKPKPQRKRQRKPAANPRGSKKAAAAAAAAAATNGVPNAVPNASPANNPQFQQNPMNPAMKFSQMSSYPDVMVVGEPSMMGSDFGQEDERTISRIENSQYDPNAMQMQTLGQGPNSSMGANNGRNMNMPPPMGPPQHHGGMPPGPPGQPHMPPHSMGNQMPNPMHNPMHMQNPGQMPNHSGMPQMSNSMANQMPPPQMPPHTMSNQMPNRMPPPPMPGQMPPPGMPGQMPNNMMGGNMPPMSMPNQMPSSMANSMPNQMPGGMHQLPPPVYNYGGPPQPWQPPPNSAMITG